MAFTLGALPPVARAGEQHVTCPASVDVRQVQARGWMTLPSPVGTLQFWDAEAISAVGPLRDAAWSELKNPPTTKKGDAVIVKYPPGTDDSDKYVICYYGEGLYQVLSISNNTPTCQQSNTSRTLSLANGRVRPGAEVRRQYFFRILAGKA